MNTTINTKSRITITIPTSLVERVDNLLRDDFLSRSQFFLTAVKEKVEKEESRKEINGLK